MMLHSKLLIVSLILLWSSTSAEFGSWASTLHRIGRLVGVAPIESRNVWQVLNCVNLCQTTPNCTALQYNDVSHNCELLDKILCDSGTATGFTLDGDAQWRYYDLDQNRMNLRTFLGESMCTAEGKCSIECGRELGEPCLSDIQCLAVSSNSHCNSSGICECVEPYWQYNTTLCIKNEAYYASHWNWVGRRIMDGVCTLTFSAIFARHMDILLGSLPEYKSGIETMHFYIGWYENTRSSLNINGAQLWGILEHAGPVLTNTLQNFTISFCDGKLRFGYEGQTPFLSYDDPSPFVAKFIGFKSTNPDTKGYVYFKENVVDPYFPTNIETKTRYTNGHFWYEFALVPIGDLITSTYIHFSFKGYNHPHIRVARWNDHYYQFNLRFNYNGYAIELYTRWTNWVPYLQGQTLTSTTEFRSFWITIVNGLYRFGIEGGPALITYQAPIAVTFQSVTYVTTHNNDGYWKFHTNMEVHEHAIGWYPRVD